MSGGVEGVALREALQRIERCMNQLIPNLSIETRRANTGAIVQAAHDFADLRKHLTAPPARTYAEGVSGEALFRAFMASDVTRLTTTALPEEWPHMMPSYRAAWEDLAIRLLSQGGGK